MRTIPAKLAKIKTGLLEKLKMKNKDRPTKLLGEAFQPEEMLVVLPRPIQFQHS
jgi:hypothetical protein